MLSFTGVKMKITFNYNGEKYFIVSWSFDCHLMEIQKQGGKIGRFIKYDDKLKVSDFMKKLDKVNFC